MEIKNIKKSLFMSIASFSSYIGIIFTYTKLYSALLIFSYILPVLIAACLLIFTIEIKKDKLIFEIPKHISNNIIYIILFWIGFILSTTYICGYLMFLIDGISK